MSAALQRVDLNLPARARLRLRALAKATRKPEGVYARELLLEAIDRAEREAFKRRLTQAHTAERRTRDREILEAVESPACRSIDSTPHEPAASRRAR